MDRAQEVALLQAAEAVVTHGGSGMTMSLAEQLGLQVQEQKAQLELEGRTRAELEDMLLRIERHFKAEQAARRKVREGLARPAATRALG